MKITAIVAVSENNIIGVNGRIPWHIPEDLKRFKAETYGHALIVGRETFKSIGKPLPGRHSFIVSKEWLYRPNTDLRTHCKSISDAITRAKNKEYEKAYIIGGENIYRDGMQYCDEVHLTRVHTTVEYRPDDIVARFYDEYFLLPWEANFQAFDSGQTSDGKASFYKYVRVR